ncbi:VWA domain-containing protein [Lutibacter sp. TH_r2]|uniref:VWA domain-containing protein n=1 Tax=Lutibacter sp. TH_r2 TaxID=3082083 RepID=UPI0029541122|nr:VWA domain-containing protein [Lutibacter sp. TH_r2]MDV7188341.1 VWA domain-containing protein [Lutibacter sp. TH_r2]
MSTETILYILLSGILALAIALFQYWYKLKQTKTNYILLALRFLALFTLMLLLINPSIKKTIFEIEKPNLVVAIDQSKSIKYSKQVEIVQTLVDNLKNSSALNNKYNIQYYGFGKELYALDTLKYIENQTNISNPIQEFSKIYGENNPVLLITDGNQTFGNSIEFLKPKNPINSFIVGDTTSIEDIYISRLNVNKQTYINNRLPVEIFVNYAGKNTVSKKLKILHKGKTVHSETIKLSKNNNVLISSFYIKVTEKGTQYYTAIVENLDSEKNTANNSKSFSINVIEEKTKILLISDVVHPDLGMLKKSIETNKQREVTIKKPNKIKGKITDYQLVILYQPTSSFKSVLNEIKNNKQHFFIISGSQTDWDFLNKAQSYFKKDVLNQTESYVPKLNLQYESFVTEDIGFKSFSPLEDKFGDVSFNIPLNILLYQKIGAFETDKPMLATFEIDEIKAGILFGENSWRWRMQSFIETKNFEQFDNFISSLVLYLASNKSKNRLQVSVEPIYFSNEIVQFSAVYLDNNLSFDSRAKLWLTIKNNATNKLSKFPFALSNNSFVAEISNLNSGEYNYTITTENQNVSSSGVFKVEPFEVEQQFLNANDENLKLLANKTGGKVYYSKDSESVINNLIATEKFKSIQKSTLQKTPLINWKWLLAFVIILLSTEWFLRKYFGKI